MLVRRSVGWILVRIYDSCMEFCRVLISLEHVTCFIMRLLLQNFVGPYVVGCLLRIQSKASHVRLNVLSYIAFRHRNY